MKTFLHDADSRIDEQRVGILVAEIRDLAYDAENVVESYLLKASSSERHRTQGGLENIVKRGVCVFYASAYHQKFSREIKHILTRMENLSNLFRDYKIISMLEEGQETSSSDTPPGRLKRFYSYAVVEPDIFVGFQGDVESLTRHLVNGSDDSYPVIFIGGMGGLGKTTLAKKIYNHSTIKTHFEGLAWVSISQKWQPRAVLQRILISLVYEKKAEFLLMEVDKLVKNLSEIQQRKKCLIVLDDIWSNDAWDSLKAAFPTETSGSKLLLTSRNIDVAYHVNPKCFIHKPKVLDAEQSWDLLRLKAFPKEDYLGYKDVMKMEELGREMVQNCAGLPLAIVVLGGVLVTKPTFTEWEKVYYDSLSSLKRGKGLGEDYQREVFDILVWSYKFLPTQLKLCFLYLGKFSKGKFISCRLHDLMRDLSLSIAKREDLFIVINLREVNNFLTYPSVELTSSAELTSSHTRQLVGDADAGGIKDNPYLANRANQRRLRSVLLIRHLFDGRLRPISGSHVANFRFQRVFALEGVDLNMKRVPGCLSHCKVGKVLGSLVYLRYLSLRRSKLLMFPSTQKLELLETLKLDDLKDDINFPPRMSKNILGELRRLRHLYLPWTNGKLMTKGSKLRLDNFSELETLENFDTRWLEIKDLTKLINLRKLSVKVVQSYDDMEEMMKYLPTIASSSGSTTSCLRYLSLYIKECNLRSQNGPDILRQLLSDSLNLHELSIDGPISELVSLFEQQHEELHNHIDHVFSNRITAITLRESCLEEDPMPWRSFLHYVASNY